MTFHFLFPSDPLHTKRPDETFLEQLEALKAKGFSTSLVSLEALASSTLKLPTDATVIYRGWMLSKEGYGQLINAIQEANAKPLTSLETYLLCHHLPNWYPLIRDYTPETKVLSLDDDIEGELKNLGWGKYFVKDYVKSLKTSFGSILENPEDVTKLIAEMQKFRGQIEGGLCVRRVESFLPDTERRYFVIKGKPFTASESMTIPELVVECAKRIPSAFFSVDVIEREDGVMRVVELGDGQVSDLVGFSNTAGFSNSGGWSAERFAEVCELAFKEEV
jgi:hypothetical protein